MYHQLKTLNLIVNTTTTASNNNEGMLQRNKGKADHCYDNSHWYVCHSVPKESKDVATSTHHNSIC